jgi:signal transduction histidine kinase
VSSVLEQVTAEARARTGERVSFASRLLPGAVVQVRPEVLHQVLSALLLNAGDAIPGGRRGRVEVEVARVAGGRILVTVSDDGVGMPPEVARRVFEPFFTTKGEGQGSGLGLSVARALAESHGGELSLESQPGRGTRALLELPETSGA